MEIQESATFRKWIISIKDPKTLLIVKRRILRLTTGLLGNSKSVGRGVMEAKIYHGKGIRIYYSIQGNVLLLLLNGGTKHHQSKDIQKAQATLQDWEKGKDD